MLELISAQLVKCGAHKALNEPLKQAPDGTVTASVENQAQQLANLATSAQKALGVDSRERTEDLAKMSKLVKNLTNPASVLDETNQLLDKDNLKIVSDSKFEIWEGMRNDANSPYYLAVGLKTTPVSR